MPSAVEEKKRLFFGLEIHAPWPYSWPKGRVIQQQHLTVAFLGSVSYATIQEILPEIPHPPFLIGPCGWFDSSLLLPEQNPRVVAWHAHWFDDLLPSFQKQLTAWLNQNEIPVDEKNWLSHVTVCRNPLEIEKWMEFFHPLPCFGKSLHLYESLGHSTYQSLWSFPLLLPFEEIEHTADVAFRIVGKDMEDLYRSAFTALAFKDPSLLEHSEKKPAIDSLDDVVIFLNDAISRADRFNGCPFKAVSFHGEAYPFKKTLLQWEMIVDI